MQTEQAMAILIAIRPPILHALPAAAEMEKARVARAFCDGGEGGIRTPVPVTRQDAFEAGFDHSARSKAPRCALAVGAPRRLPSGARLPIQKQRGPHVAAPA